MKTSQKVFQILDLDRTLLNTPKLAHHLKDIIAKNNARLAQDIHDEIAKHHMTRTSFFIFEFIAKKVGEETFRSYLEELHQMVSSTELFLPGAKERIAYAKSQPGWGVGIMTYGSKRDQMIKLKLLGLQLEHLLITDSPYKGKAIASWQQADGTFKLPIEFGGHTVDTLTLDDDKRIAFDELPRGVYGQWLTPASLGGATELQYLPQNVRAVSDLEASIRYLKTKLNSF